MSVKKLTSKRVAVNGLFTALALIISLFENLLPPIVPVLPFAKVGISHIVILFSLIILGFNEAILILVIRNIFVAIFVGNISMLMYSMPAGIISILITYSFLKSQKFSLCALSALSGSIHNLVQVIIASLITQTTAVFSYLPYLMLFGSIAGFVTGLVTMISIKKIPIKFIKKYV